MYMKTKSLLVLGALFFYLILVGQWPPLADASPALVCAVPGDFGTIQAAVDDPDCETINVGNGIFTENVTIDRMVTIAGQGADNTEVNGNASDSVFTVATGDLVTLKDLKISNGFADSGGGISNINGMVVVENSTISGNSASFRGGGIFSQGAFGTANTSIINSTISGNAAETRGGGINNEGDDATVTIVDSTIDDNSASEGAGIFNLGAVSIENSILSSNSADQGGGAFNSGTLTFANSSISGNFAQEGGGLYNMSAFGIVTVMSSTLSVNEAIVDGGGVWNSGTIQINHSTLSGNSAYMDLGITSMLGGGIYNSGGSVTLQSSTLSDNYAGLEGDSVFNDGGSVTLSNSILSNVNVNLPDTDDDNCAGDDVTSAGFNLENGTTCNLAAAGDMPDSDPLLSPLVDNGGETPTHALLTGSPAIDAGNCPGEDADQRGFSRPVDMLGVPNVADACDIGAYEVQYVIYLPFIPRH